MACVIDIEGLVQFAPNIGVMVAPQAVDADPAHLYELICRAYSHMGDELLRDACHGGAGPLANVGTIDYQEYLRLAELDAPADESTGEDGGGGTDRLPATELVDHSLADLGEAFGKALEKLTGDEYVVDVYSVNRRPKREPFAEMAMELLVRKPFG